MIHQAIHSCISLNWPVLQRKVLLTSCFLLCLSGLFSQNLIPNPDFETYSSCPPGYEPGFGPMHATHWWNPTGGSSDYLNSCHLGGVVGVPNNAFGNRPAHSGNAYAGSLFYYAGIPHYREYLQVRLLEPLVAGKVYQVSLYYSFAELTCAVDKLGVHLGDTQVIDPGGYGVLNVEPQLELAPVDSTGWQIFSKCYAALGGEEWLTIGNFYADTNLTIETACPPWGGLIVSYIYIDDVQVVETAPVGVIDFTVGSDTIVCDSLVITGPLQDVNYTWQDGSHDQSFTARVTGEYIVTVTQGCSVGFDTINVTVMFNPEQIDLGPDTVVCPFDTLLLELDTAYGDFIWQDGSVLEYFQVTMPGQYAITAANSCGTGKDTIEISEAQMTVASFNYELDGSEVFFVNLSVHGFTAQWDFGDGTTSSEWNPSHQYAESGVYPVVLIVNGLCNLDTFSLEITVQGTSVENVNLQPELVIFPNPNPGSFQVLHLSSHEFYRVQVLDPLGRGVAFAQEDAQTFRLLNARPGIYTVVLNQEKSKVIGRLIVR